MLSSCKNPCTVRICDFCDSSNALEDSVKIDTPGLIVGSKPENAELPSLLKSTSGEEIAKQTQKSANVSGSGSVDSPRDAVALEDAILLERIAAASRLAAEEERRQREEEELFRETQEAARKTRLDAKREDNRQARDEQEQARLEQLQEQRERDALSAFLLVNGLAGADTKRKRLLSSSYPLHVAVERNDPEAVRLLLRAGAERGRKNSSGRTPLQLAERRNKKGTREQVLALLRVA